MNVHSSIIFISAGKTIQRPSMVEGITKCGMHVITNENIRSLQRNIFPDSTLCRMNSNTTMQSERSKKIKGHVIYDSIYMKCIE